MPLYRILFQAVQKEKQNIWPVWWNVWRFGRLIIRYRVWVLIVLGNCYGQMYLMMQLQEKVSRFNIFWRACINKSLPGFLRDARPVATSLSYCLVWRTAWFAAHGVLSSWHGTDKQIGGVLFEACRAALSGDHDIKKGDESAMFKYRSRYCDIQTSRHFID